MEYTIEGSFELAFKATAKPVAVSDNAIRRAFHEGALSVHDPLSFCTYIHVRLMNAWYDGRDSALRIIAEKDSTK